MILYKINITARFKQSVKRLYIMKDKEFELKSNDYTRRIKDSTIREDVRQEAQDSRIGRSYKK